ncbi:MAG: aspartate/glutamate racemase family protein [Magnetococcales bacterium]|nr:aspartate/glutamate racemase family protein [Magnetococcales bacterium]
MANGSVHGTLDMEDAPLRVRRTVAFLRENHVWHVISRNSMSTSCQDAANRRNRLGAAGIPLHDEVKSLHMVGYFSDGIRRHVLLHCRANARFNLDAAAAVLQTTRPLERLSADELMNEFGARYGTVNPFSDAEECIQLFDENMLSRYTPPHTMMTNAGDLTWAVEFRPQELITALGRYSSKVSLARITGRETQHHSLPVFGIITGNGPESGMTLWKQLNGFIYDSLSEVDRLHGDLSYPRICIQSIPEMGLSMELVQREDDVWGIIQQAVGHFISQGVTHIAIACNTTQYFSERIREICAPHGVIFISLADVTLEYIREKNIDDITIIGIPIVADLGPYSAYAPLKDLHVHPVKDIAKSHLQELGYMVKQMGTDAQDSKALNKLVHIINSGVSTRRVIIALTEISVLLGRFPKKRRNIGDKEIIDPLELYSQKLARIFIDALPSTTPDTIDSWE